jgi:hypothetical protein
MQPGRMADLITISGFLAVVLVGVDRWWEGHD